MKRVIIAIVALVASITSISAQRLGNINIEALYITDKMVAELGLNSYQRNSILQINLNYLNGITSYRDIESSIWKQRNKSLKAMLSKAQWSLYQKTYYFYRPIGWRDGAYVHNIYAKYPRSNARPQRPKPRKECCKPAPRYDKKQYKSNRAPERNRKHESFGSRR